MQLYLPGLTIPAARPLVPLEACMVLLDRDEDELLAAIEDGSLPWAWDIRGAGAERREIRVWRESVLEWVGRDGNRGSEIANLKLEIGNDMPGDILPHRDLRTTELQRLFCCSQKHAQGLIEAGLLVPVRARPVESGPNAFTLVARPSVTRFLRERRVDK
jgi:hypothetical protein